MPNDYQFSPKRTVSFPLILQFPSLGCFSDSLQSLLKNFKLTSIMASDHNIWWRLITPQALSMRGLCGS